MTSMTFNTRIVDFHTFEDNQDQSHISQCQKGLLPILFQDVSQRSAVDDPHGDIADNPGPNDFGRNPFCQRQKEKKRYDDKYFNDCLVSFICNMRRIDQIRTVHSCLHTARLFVRMETASHILVSFDRLSGHNNIQKFNRTQPCLKGLSKIDSSVNVFGYVFVGVSRQNLPLSRGYWQHWLAPNRATSPCDY